ncbi:MAG: 5-(carboxyamino)imidazole ribonucleotide synthase [Acidobacteriota bacterium]
MSRPPAILPGSTVGVLGSGQLGRMLALEARAMGYRIHTLSPSRDTPTGQVADLEVVAAYDDLDAVSAFARGVDVVTFEFENVSAEATRVAAEEAPVRPDGMILHTTQNRLREKRFLTDQGFPVAPFREVRSAKDLAAALAEIGAPAVLKTAGFGYDGKGQIKVEPGVSPDDLWREFRGDLDSQRVETAAVLEGFVDFEREVSVVAARGLDGSLVDYGVLANDHRHHILDVTVSPAPVSPRVAAEAQRLAHGIVEAVELVGVLCVEMFLQTDGRLIVNELAPRPHNSGHLTVDAHLTSQFEQQLRAVCGLTLGSTERLRPAAMVNLLGDLWQHGEPDWAAVAGEQNLKLHLYGKGEARPGRKMGHLTVLAGDAGTAKRQALASRALLESGG